MKKGDIIHTPKGPAKVVQHVVKRGHQSGVRMQVIETGEDFRQVRCIVDRWQIEAKEASKHEPV